MATFSKFNAFSEALAEGKFNLGSDTLKVYLSNTAPSAATHTAYDGTTGTTGPAEIAAGNGYVAGGKTAPITSSQQTAGVYKLVLADPGAWVATADSIGPFQYAVLYSDTAASKNLIGWWNYGTPVTLAQAESFSVDFDPGTGVLTIQ